MFNLIDILIILVIAYFIVEGWQHGFWVMLTDFVTFLGSLIISLKFYAYSADLIYNNFPVSKSISTVIGFLLTAVVSEAILSILALQAIKLLPLKLRNNKTAKYLSVLPSVGEGIVIVSFLLLLIMGLPVNPKIKTEISSSKIGGVVVEKTQSVEAKLKVIFGGIIEETISYMIIEPDSSRIVSIQAVAGDLSIDETSEKSMFDFVNKERQKVGVKELQWYSEAVGVARAHAGDMWKRQYFGHISPEGKDVGTRLEEAGIEYLIVGENLALAPTVQTAMTGLMNSDGHKRNILDPNFDKVSIGVIDNGIYGKMFVQIFIK